MSSYIHMEESSSGLKSYKWKGKNNNNKPKMQNQTKNPNKTKNQTTIPKTANKGAVGNAALFITSLQTHPEYMLCFYTLVIKAYAGFQKN